LSQKGFFIQDYVYDLLLLPSPRSVLVAEKAHGIKTLDGAKDQNLYCGPAADVLTNAEGSGPSTDRRLEWQAICTNSSFKGYLLSLLSHVTDHLGSH
jgi:hypothetical protein